MITNTDFNMTNFLWREATQSTTSQRGLKEKHLVDKWTARAKESNKTPFLNPFSLRALTTTNSAGGHTVADKISASFSQFYSDSFFIQKATLLTRLTSDVKIDSISTSGVLTNNAVAETTDTANEFSTEPAYSQNTLTPKFIRVSLNVSSQLLEQTSNTIGNLILEDLSNNLSSELDRQILVGTGNLTNSNEINGIINTSGIGSTTWGGLGALTGSNAQAGVVAAEKSLGDEKVPVPYAWLLNSETRAKLRSIRAAGNTYPILDNQNSILGYPVFVTENVADADCWLVNGRFVVLGLWNDSDDDYIFDLLVDGYSKSINGIVTITLSILADAALIKPKALHAIRQS